MTVVRHETRRRWVIVLTTVALLCALPAAVQAWPVRTAAIDPLVLRDRINGSAGQPYQGYALSSSSMGLPALPRLAEVTALASGTIPLRAWYRDPGHWRVDVIDAGNERGVYRSGDAEHLWDYGANQLTRVAGAQPVRLPRAADLVPPELARRLVRAAADDRISALPARRVAGISAAGLRITPTGARTTVAHVDIWAEPRTGLPLHAEITGRGADRPVLATRFLEITLTAPAAEVLAAPTPRAGIGFTVTHTPDLLTALERVNLGALPARLVGQPRRGLTQAVSVGVYGTGLAQYAVLPVPGRLGYEAYDSAVRWGRPVTLPGGEAGVIATALVSLLVVKSTRTGRTFLLAGPVDVELLQQAAAELTAFRR